MNALRKSRVVAGVVIVLVFAAGVAVGFFVHGTMPRHGFPGLAIVGPPAGPPRELKGWMLGRLDRELKLSPEQHARIDTVLTRSEADIRGLMTETRPRFEAIATRTRSRDPGGAHAGAAAGVHGAHPADRGAPGKKAGSVTRPSGPEVSHSEQDQGGMTWILPPSLRSG